MPRPNIYLLITVLFWGFNFISLKIVYQEVSPPGVLFGRFVLAWAVLLAYCFAIKEPFLPPKHLRGRIWIGGFISMGVYMILFLEGTSRTGPAEAAVILSTIPILTSLFSSLLGTEVFSWPRLVGAITAFAGVVLVILGRGQAIKGEWIGDLLALASAVAWAASVVILRPAMAEVKPITMYTMSLTGAAPVVLIYGIQAGLATPWGHLDAWTYVNLLQISLLSGVVGFAFFYRGVAQLGASNASLYQFLVPPITVCFAFFFRHEQLKPIQGVGLLILLLGLYLSRGTIRQAVNPALPGSTA